MSSSVTSLHQRYVTRPGNCPSGPGDGGVKMPALHPDRVEEINFVLYKAPPVDCFADKATAEEWMTRVSFIEDDLRWLLKLPHDRFWCQVVFDSSIHQCISSFLHHAPRPFDLGAELPTELKRKNDSLLHLFFLVCLRMSTHKESKNSYISPDVFGEILYENYIFDIPKIMDLCVLYGKNNEALVGKMVANIFGQQKKYYDDLQHIISTIVQVLDNILTSCGFANDILSPPRQLTDQMERQRNTLVSMSSQKFQDVILYLSDIAHTLRSFLEVFPQGALSFRHENFLQRLAVLYEAASAGFAVAFRERENAAVGLNDPHLLKKTLHLAKGCFLHVFHKVLFSAFLGPLLESSSEEMASEYAEGYIISLTGVLSEKRFLADLQTLYPFDEDKDILSQSIYKIDPTRLKYIDDAVSEAVALYGHRKHPDISKQTAVSAAIADDTESKNHHQTEDREYDSYEELGACAPMVTGIELDSLISSIKDLFQDLGDGFIKLCLEEYNYDSEKVISAVLEDDLRPSLRDIDRSLKRDAVHKQSHSKSKETENGPVSAVVEKSLLLSQRRNIFDGDEFDVLQHDIDFSKVHLGKKNKNLGDNKLELTNLKSFYKNYEDIVDVTSAGDDDDYNDEYDDTYDSNVVGMIDDDSPDELVARRPFVTPRVLEKTVRRGKEEESSSEEENDEEKNKKRDHFIEDPAKLRQMREERFAARAANQRRGRGHHTPSENSREVNRDVKGGPKGQGQSTEVLRNRAYKERHKDTRAHHNRKDLADRKRKI